MSLTGRLKFKATESFTLKNYGFIFMRPILIAKTPRAGEFNHRYLVADSFDLESNDVLDWARRTTSRICGPDFFAVYHDVTQLRGGRTGEEGLMLIGIDTAALGEYQRVLLEQLQALLPDLETLVTQEMVWQDYSHEGMVIACPKLNEWMNDLEQTFKQRVGAGSGFPAYVPPQINVDQKPNVQVVPHDSSNNKVNKILLIISGISILLLAFCGFYFFMQEKHIIENCGTKSLDQAIPTKTEPKENENSQSEIRLNNAMQPSPCIVTKCDCPNPPPASDCPACPACAQANCSKPDNSELNRKNSVISAENVDKQCGNDKVGAVCKKIFCLPLK